MWRTVIICTVIGLIDANKKATFHNYTVFRIIPSEVKHVELLRQLDETPDELIFWKEPSFVNRQVDLMVAPHKLPIFHEMMTQIKAPHKVFIEDVQTLIDQSSTIRSTSFDFKNYHTLEVIYKNLDDLAKKYPDKVQTVVGGTTYEGRQIKGVKVSFKPNNPGIFIEGGIHAREWIAPATVMYTLYQLLTSNDSDVRNLAERHDWYIFPSFNPDGYVYTHKYNRMWRKTREPSGNYCRGTDPNRNWDYEWNKGGASNNSCDETYAGSAPLSLIETKSMSKYIKSICDKFYAYISFHSYSQLLMFPYSYTKDHVDNYDDLKAIGTKAIKALQKRYGTIYNETGSIYETIYPTSGNSLDYIYAVRKKCIVYAYELRDKGKYGFLLPRDQIIPTGEETLDSLVAMFKEAKALGYPKDNKHINKVG